VATGDSVLHVSVRDDGRGGAHFGHGSGLVGLKDRAEALGGRISLHSAPGAGTSVQVSLPLDGPSMPGRPAAVTARPDEAGHGHAADPGPPGPARGI
jgi:signal transduction histidine kinase